MKNLSVAVLCLILVGCGYIWAYTYDLEANASLAGNLEVSSNEAIKNYLSEFAADGDFKFIDQKLVAPSRNAISIYLERKDVLIFVTTVPNGTWLNVGFYKSKRKKHRPDDATLNQLANKISNDLENISGVEITEKKISG